MKKQILTLAVSAVVSGLFADSLYFQSSNTYHSISSNPKFQAIKATIETIKKRLDMLNNPKLIFEKYENSKKSNEAYIISEWINIYNTATKGKDEFVALTIKHIKDYILETIRANDKQMYRELYHLVNIKSKKMKFEIPNKDSVVVSQDLHIRYLPIVTKDTKITTLQKGTFLKVVSLVEFTNDNGKKAYWLYVVNDKYNGWVNAKYVRELR